MATIEERLQQGELVIIDGTMGTEFERRGVPMDALAWSGAAVIDFPDIVVGAHRDHIDAGAEAIITNAFDMSPFMLAATRHADKAEEGLRQAVKLARQACDAAGFDPMARVFDEEGADAIALEMMQDMECAPLAMAAAKRSRLPVWLGVTCARA